MANRLRYPGFGLNRPALKYQQSASDLSWLTDPLQGASSSSYGSYGGGYGLDPGSCFSLDICPDLILAAVAAAAAVAAFLIYQAITMAGKRRRRRSEDLPLESSVGDLLWLGRIISPCLACHVSFLQLNM